MTLFPPGVRSGLWLVFLLLLTAAVRCWNAADLFVGEAVFFTDPDCYSRMTRVQKVIESPGKVIQTHDFENWPQGTTPHTTAPLDYVIAGMAGVLKPFTARSVDLAGAWIGVLFGLAAAAFLWFWRGLRPYRIPMGLLFAVSPILVHGTALGRPDHQSILILCLTVALGAEAVLLGERSRKWGLAAGAAWALALWVSLYEPAVLFVAAMALAFILNPRGVFSRERLPGWGLFIGVLALAACVDGWRVPVPDPEVVRYFPNWSRTIGELARLSPFSNVWLSWTLAWLPITPVLLVIAGRRGNRMAWFWLGLLVALFALTSWQVRWGYFFALAFVMSLPIQMETLARFFGKRGRVVTLTLFALALWPAAREWDRQFGPEETRRRQEQRDDNIALYDVAQQLRGERRLPILAPWWFSPALAYWSGQPCVAGSSHQSLPGTVDTARYYLSTDPEAGEAILAWRRIACVLAYEPFRVIANSAAILGKDAASIPSEDVLVTMLYTRPNSPHPGLEFVHANRAFRVYLRPAGIE